MIKILFIDTSALLSFFVSDKGTTTMRWLMSSGNKTYNATRYIINNQVINDFESKLEELVKKDKIKEATASNILNLFNTHYKDQIFKVVGKDASVKDTLDGMYNFLGGISRPILVTSNNQQIGNTYEYKVINPETQTPEDIELALRGKKPKTAKPNEVNLYRKLCNMTRMAISL